MRKNYSERSERIRSAVLSAAVCPITVFICMLLCSWLTVTFDLTSEAVGFMSGLSLCAGCFAGAFAAGNIRRRKGIIIGFAFGGAVFIVLILASVFIMKSFSAESAFGRFVLILLCSAAGGIVGVNTKALFR